MEQRIPSQVYKPLRFAFAALAALACLGGGQADPVNKDRQGVALKGYDPVAYFQLEQPAKGKEQFNWKWSGATWWFASAENRGLFMQAPEKYAPQFGGYCAWAVSQGYTASIDPDAWKIVDGKLYLNYSKGVQRKWEQDVPTRIKEAERNWPSLHR